MHFVNAFVTRLIVLSRPRILCLSTESYSFRLSGEATNSEGTLEVSPDNLPWSLAVECINTNRYTDHNTPRAICHHLGYHGGIQFLEPTTQTNTTNLHLSHIECGRQDRLHDCYFTPWIEANCKVYVKTVIICSIGKYIFIFLNYGQRFKAYSSIRENEGNCSQHLMSQSPLGFRVREQRNYVET